MRIRMAWVASGCLVICLLALAEDSLLSTGWSRLGSPAVAGVQPRLRMTEAMTSLSNENHSYGYYSFGRLPGRDAVSAVGVPVVANAAPSGTDRLGAVTVAKGSQIAAGTLGMVVLGSDGRSMDRLAVSPGDILLRRGDTMQDESARAATVSAPLAQVEVARHLVILDVSALVFGDSAPAVPSSQRRSDVLIVLLLPSTRLSLPHGQALADLMSEQEVQVTGTLNRRTHTMLRPTSFLVGAAPGPRQCTMLSVSGDQDCAGQPVNTR